jgi:hypothetical protein
MPTAIQLTARNVLAITELLLMTGLVLFYYEHLSLTRLKKCYCGRSFFMRQKTHLLLLL